MRKTVAWTTVAIMASGISGIAYAGEITGGPNPKATPAGDMANSECAFSGQEDGVTRVFDPQSGTFVFYFDTPTGPGYVQTPHQENGRDIIHEPGVAGLFCRGN